ncbi:MAG: biopolymer transporter ExbD [Candidatus Syntrophosphaera sp.]|nr:biopolymer transporter ExbD [Candidatus Syntrophosphaera sp.]
MKVSRKRKRKVEIPNASMSDIAFLLIIFFMATTKFDIKEGVKVQLNKAVSAEQQQTTEVKLTELEMTRIEITESGLLKINTEEPRSFTDDELNRLILEKIEMRDRLNRESTDPEVRQMKMLFLVKTNTEAKYNDMVRVVDHLVTYRDRAMISISTQI